MYKKLEGRLRRLGRLQSPRLLRASSMGVEKETLRVNRAGSIAQTDHPSSLGSALTHPFITTDYSEALIEFITPPLPSVPEVLAFLRDAQQFVYERLQDEYLWATSMPCVVAGETSVRIAEYGRSNSGMMKHIYRRGLGYRYGRTMQVIAGVHFNYSLAPEFWPIYAELEGYAGSAQDFISESYMALIRNLQRLGWLIPYLFGASPAVCRSFLGGAATNLQEFDANTCYGPYATSLRMGDIGYQNNRENEHGIKASYDSLPSYIDSLTRAIETPCPEYAKIGVVVDGEYRQLNANILQIENEYYSTIRPKQRLKGNEKPTVALKRRGIEYVELRSINVNAFDPLGINQTQLYFLESFLLFCLLQDSPPISAGERKAIDGNELAAAHQGRNPELRLQRRDGPVLLRDWADEVCAEMRGICEMMDSVGEGTPYCDALAAQVRKVGDASLTPSARMLENMWEHKEGFYHFARRMSETHQRFFMNLPRNPERERFFMELAARSIEEQKAREAAEEVPFDVYLARYFAQR